MGTPKRKQPAPSAPPAREPTEAEREEAEDRADVEAYDAGMAAWEADGRRTIPWEQVKRELDLK